MPWNYQNKNEKRDLGMLFLFKNGRQASCCAYDILLYENMMRVSYLYQKDGEKGKQNELPVFEVLSLSRMRPQKLQNYEL